jgi:hypothetical protein
MLAAICIGSAALLIAWPWIAERAATFAATGGVAKIDRRQAAAAVLLVAGALSYFGGNKPAVPTPAPPAPDAKLILKGKFVGPDAAVDAAITAALMEEVAAELEFDAGLPEPLLRTGQAMDQLRQRARLLLCRGVSLGEKHPRARDAIKAYLDAAAGVAGGPLSPAERAAWVSAYREVARAAADASR